jgi:hypothetical protein
MAGTVKHVVVMVQENHTVDNYFGGLAPWGANVATGWPPEPNPPRDNPAHGRHDYFNWLTARGKAPHTQFNTASVLPYYLWLAVNGSFLENHCAGFGTNSTPNHLLVVGGQTPTLRNPPPPDPVWDLPSLPGLAEDNGVSWRGYTGTKSYPLCFYKQLKGSAKVVASDRFVADAAAVNLPQLSMIWHDSPNDEHPVADVTLGQGKIWQVVDAVVKAGLWNDTVFMLTYDDWGGWDDHVATPVVEYTPDNVQLAYGPRVPLLMFGGNVKTGIDSRWCSHVSITKTAIQLLGLPKLGVGRVDSDPGLVDLVDQGVSMATPPAFGSRAVAPQPPQPPRRPHGLPPYPAGTPVLVPNVVLRDGTSLGRPNDQPLPQQPAPPTTTTPAGRPAAPKAPSKKAVAGAGKVHAPKERAPAPRKTTATKKTAAKKKAVARETSGAKKKAAAIGKRAPARRTAPARKTARKKAIATKKRAAPRKKSPAAKKKAPARTKRAKRTTKVTARKVVPRRPTQRARKGGTKTGR